MANHYECADGKWILFAEAQSDRFWHNFCCVLGREELEKDERFSSAALRNDNRFELIPILDEVFKTKNRNEWVHALEEMGGGLAYSLVLEPEELQSDPQIRDNDYITEINHPVLGKTKVIGCPIKFSKTPADVNPTAPNFGEHTEEVLMNTCHYSWEDIEKLKDDEVI
jgi:crotonobetainyl-CoA:carnitine CoA-transferase CaiB-like acyl-CoA transferase